LQSVLQPADTEADDRDRVTEESRIRASASDAPGVDDARHSQPVGG
jgi:hypothetical protein